jgi:hypothetical protein
VYNVYIANQFQVTFAQGGGGGGEYNPLVEVTWILKIFKHILYSTLLLHFNDCFLYIILF